jgi:hypothetical protein
MVGNSFGRCLRNRLLSSFSLRFTNSSLGCAEASIILRAVAADFFFNCWNLEIHSDNRIRHVPRCVHYHAQSFRLGALQDFYVGSGSRTPKLYYVSPDWLEYCFINEKFIACGEFLLPSE